MPVAPSSVAEKKSVWRSFEVWATIRSTAGLKPMSSMRSASSRTRTPDLAQRERAALDQVLEPAGRGDDDVGALRRGALRAEADAAVDGGDAQLAGLGDRGQLVDDLARQLAGRGEDERREVLSPGLDAVDQRHAEGEGLAGPGWGLDEQVVTGERVADDHLLDGKGLVDAALRKRAHDILGYAEIGERHDFVSSFLSD